MRSRCGAFDRRRRLPRGGRSGRRRGAVRRESARSVGASPARGGHSRSADHPRRRRRHRRRGAACARPRRGHAGHPPKPRRAEILLPTARRSRVRWCNEADGPRRGARPSVILATGGLVTSTAPPRTRGSTGDGIGAGCGRPVGVSDIEFISSTRPCCSTGHGGRRPLITGRSVARARVPARPAAIGDRRRASDGRSRPARRGRRCHRTRLREPGIPSAPTWMPARRLSPRRIPTVTAACLPLVSTRRGSRSRWCRARITAAAAWHRMCTAAPAAGSVRGRGWPRTGMHGASRLASAACWKAWWSATGAAAGMPSDTDVRRRGRTGAT